MKTKNRGFAALTSVLIIATVLLSTTASLSLGALNARLNVADAENKAASEALAKSCARRALLDLALGQARTGAVTIDDSTVPPMTCLIRRAETNTDGNYVVRTGAEWPQRGYRRAVTELEVVSRSSDLQIISWRELPGCHARDSPDCD